MAQLVMTIDSSDDESKKQNPVDKKMAKDLKSSKKTKSKQVIPASKAEDDEGMQLDQHINLEDDRQDPSDYKLSKKMWSFENQVIKLKKPWEETQNADEEQLEGDERAPFKISLKERIQMKMQEKNIVIHDNVTDQARNPPAKEQDDAEDEAEAKAKQITGDAKHHYDKEDLISFHELFLTKPLVKACHELDYEHPTVIQRKVVPAILEGNDVLAHAVTGSGKTAAYLLPILQNFIRMHQSKGGAQRGKLRYLVLQPTRELAAQSHSMLNNLSKYLPMFTSSAVFGGSSLKIQKRDLDAQPDMVIATTGRLIDHLKNTKGFTLEDVDVLVLDEADRLLEMGFKDELMSIVSQCKNPNRKTLMFSATLNQDLKELAGIALKKPLTFTVSQQQKKADMANLKLTQYLVRLKFDDVEKLKPKPKKPKVVKKTKKRSQMDPDFDSEEEYGKEDAESSSESSEAEMDDGKDFDSQEEEGEHEMDEGLSQSESDIPDQSEEEEDFDDRYQPDPFLCRREATLLCLVRKTFKERVIVFFNEKAQCNRALNLFTMFGLKAVQVQGNMPQNERMAAVEQFQKGEVDYLLATDLLARGIDIWSVKTVINFSFPTEPKRYLHRIGRTARAGSSGVSVTICNDEERKEIKKLLKKMNQNLNTFTVAHKQVVFEHERLQNKLDPVLHEIDLEQKQDKEMEEAYKEADRAENMIKYRAEIQSKPKTNWIMSKKKKHEVKKGSKEDLKKISKKFENQLQEQGRSDRKRDKKHIDKTKEFKNKQKQDKAAKKPKKGESTFKADREDGSKKYVPPKIGQTDSKNNYYAKNKKKPANKRPKK